MAEGGEGPIMRSPHSTCHLLGRSLVGFCIKELNEWQESDLDKKSSVHANARKQQLPFIPICSIFYEGRSPGCSSTLSRALYGTDSFSVGTAQAEDAHSRYCLLDPWA